MIRIHDVVAHLLQISAKHGNLPMFMSDDKAQLHPLSFDKVELREVRVVETGKYAPSVLIHSM